MNRQSAAVFVCLFCLVLSASSQQPGNVRGTVVDETGKPVGAAQIIVDPADDRPRARAQRVAEADADGKFVMENLPLGIYKVFPKKDSAGYPDTSFAFYSNQVFATVSLTAISPSVNLMLKVGPPVGALTGSVTDGKGNAIAATFLLRRASDADNWISMSQPSDYRILLPPKLMYCWKCLRKDTRRGIAAELSTHSRELPFDSNLGKR